MPRSRPTDKERTKLQRIRQQLQRCAGWDSDDIAQQREDAWKYYFQRKRGDEVEGRSKVVSGDLSAMVEANLATMMSAVQGAELAEFESFGEADAQQAMLESAVVNHFIMKRNNGFWHLCEAVKDALLLRNGFMNCEYDVQTRITHRTHRNVTPEAISALLGETGEVTSFENGVLRVRHTVERKRLKIEADPPENVLYMENWHSIELRDIPILARRHIWPRSDLLLKFPRAKNKINRLAPYVRDSKNDSMARNPRKKGDENFNAIDKSQDEIEWFECYVLEDADNDGISERRRIAIAGQSQNSILDEIDVPFVTTVTGTAIIIPHRMLGMSLYDKLRQEQDISTGLDRATLDNVNANNKNRLAVLEGLVNQDDLDDGRVDGQVGVDPEAQDVRRAVAPLNINDLTAGLLQHREFRKRMRAEMGGASLDLQAAEMQLNERMGSEGLDRALSVREMLAALFMQLIANSLLRNLYLLVHATLREFWDEPVPVRIGDKWIEQVPSNWPERESVTIKLGMSPGERARRSNALNGEYDKQIAMLELGGDDIVVNMERIYNNRMDFLRTNEIPNPERYWIDPTSDASKRARARKQEQAAQDTAARRALMQQAVALEQMRVAESKYEHDSELGYKYWSDVLKAELKEAEIAGRATVELVKAKETGNGNAINSAPAGGGGRTGGNGAATPGGDEPG